MALSRRNFLEVATGFPAVVLGARRVGVQLLSGPGQEGTGFLLLDLGKDCALPESLAGFEAVLRSTSISYQRAPAGTSNVARTLIAPAATLSDHLFAHWLRTCLENGASVLFETGAAYLSPGEFMSQQHWVQDYLGVTIHSPLRIWEEPHAWSRVPYLDYTWPLRTKVRDFSVVVPVSSPDGEAVGWFGETPIAVRKHIGRGMLFFLGSPMGPHLLTGDPQASCWLRELCAQAYC